MGSSAGGGIVITNARLFEQTNNLLIETNERAAELEGVCLFDIDDRRQVFVVDDYKISRILSRIAILGDHGNDHIPEPDRRCSG